jgi:CheY-like chemotaxis protein
MTGAVIISDDITERNQAEQALKEAGRRKDEFLALLAHELRNPLAPIRSAAHILNLRGTEDPDLKALYDLIGRQAGQMARLVDDLLDISRLERGKIELRRERVDFSSMVSHAVAVCRTLIETRGHQVGLELPGKALEVDGDPVRIEQMMCNLIANACKHTPPGGEIRIVAERDGNMAVLRVRDNGIGMTQEEMEHIFEMFYQGGKDIGHRAGGLGLGLTLVNSLAELHGGTITTASPGLGQGSEFTLRLPALEEGCPGQTTEPHQAAGLVPMGKSKHILVVDDNPSVVMTVKMLLKEFGYQVSVAATGTAGIKKAMDLRPDLALVDLGLPDLSGLEVAARIRAELGSAIHLIALTGFSRESDISAALAAGFEQHLVKTSDPRELVNAVNVLLS